MGNQLGKIAIAGALVFTGMIAGPLVVVGAVIDNSKNIQTPSVQIAPGATDAFGALNTDAIPDKNFLPWLARAGALCPEIPSSLLAAQLYQESGFKVDAKSVDVPGMHSGGAEGPAQFMPATWAEIGQDDDGNGTVSPYDIGDAVMAQGRYMCQMVVQVKQLIAAGKLPDEDPVTFALAGYNAGLNAVQKYGGIPPFAETQQYVPQIAQLAATKFTAAGGGATTPAAGGGGTVQPGPAGPLNAAILNAALPYEGWPYVWAGGGAQGPDGIDEIDGRGPGFDCSGLTQYAVYKATGGQVTLPRVSRDQGRVQPHVVAVAEADRQPGDLIAFKFDTRNGGGATDWDHVGIYSGDGKMFNAPESGKNIGYADLTRSFYANAPHAYFRIVL